MGILIGETNADAREVPFYLPDADDPRVGLTGVTFADVGGGYTDQVRARTPGGAYADVLIVDVVEKGYGIYAVKLTSSQVLTAGSVYVYADVPGAQPWTGVEVVADQLSGIMVGETVDARREVAFHLPDADDPLTPVTGHVFSTGEVKVALPGGAFSDADVTKVVEKGYGDYALTLTSAQVVTKGKVFLYVEVAGAQVWSSWVDVVDEVAPPASAESYPTITIVSPTPGTPIPRDTPVVFRVTDSAALRVVFTYVSFAGFIPWEVVHDGFGFGPTFAGPTNTRTSIDGGYEFTVLRDGGWPRTPNLRVLPVNAHGYLPVNA